MSMVSSSLAVANRLSAISAQCSSTIPIRFIGRFKPFVEKTIRIKETRLRAKNQVRCYLWGGTLTGALGRDKFVRPVGLPTESVRSHCCYPSKLRLSENHLMWDLACGHGFTIFAARHEKNDNNYELFGCGINSDSQLGLQTADNRAAMKLLTEPVPILFPEHENGERIHVSKVAAGRAHAIIITTTGTVYSIGNNSLGQCGREIDPDEEYFGRDNLKKIRNLPRGIVEAVCGLDHTLFLTREGEVYACGWGADGQTGLGHYRNIAEPERVRGDIDGVRIVELASRGDCTLAVSEAGDVFGWGNNEYGQLLGEKGESQRHTPKHLPFNKRIAKVAAGGSSCLALDGDGIVYSWGFGILALGPNVAHSATPQPIPLTLFGTNELSPDCRVVSLVSGLNNFAAINSEGHLYTWGRNQNGSLGLGNGHRRPQMFPLRVNLSASVKKLSIGVDHMAVLTQSFC